MLFYVSWKPRSGQGPEEQKKTLEIFSRWKAPEGMEFKAFYGRADGGGFCICEVDSSETIYGALAPWAGVYNDYDVMPIVEVERAVELLNEAVAFREG